MWFLKVLFNKKKFLFKLSKFILQILTILLNKIETFIYLLDPVGPIIIETRASFIIYSVALNPEFLIKQNLLNNFQRLLISLLSMGHYFGIKMVRVNSVSIIVSKQIFNYPGKFNKFAFQMFTDLIPFYRIITIVYNKTANGRYTTLQNTKILFAHAAKVDNLY